jgi:hypothetical protein
MANNSYTIIICCQEGHGTLEALRAFWEKENIPSHNVWIDYDGTRHWLVSYEQDDSKTFLLTYRGGVQQDNTAVAVDTRTQAQKNALLNEIIEIKDWLSYQNPDGFELQIMGKCEYDFGLFPFRIKENPCFDVMEEYGFLV